MKTPIGDAVRLAGDYWRTCIEPEALRDAYYRPEHLTAERGNYDAMDAARMRLCDRLGRGYQDYTREV